MTETDVNVMLVAYKSDLQKTLESLITNAQDKEKYSDGLLKGYTMAVNQFKNRFTEFYEKNVECNSDYDSEWFCPTYMQYLSGEQVSFEEAHVLCGTKVK